MIYNRRVLIHPAAAALLLAALPARAQKAPRVQARIEEAFSLGQLGLVDVPEGEIETEDALRARLTAVERLSASASDSEAPVRRAAVEALGKLGGPDTATVLQKATSDADAAVRGEAALALFRQRYLKHVPDYSTDTVRALIRLASDPDAEVRWRAAYAFSRWPEPRALAAASALQSDADSRARLFALRALEKLAAAPDAARLADPDVYVRAEAVAALSAAKAWDRIPDAVFADPSPHVRAAAADAAADSGDAARFGPLLTKLEAGPGTLAPGRALLALAKLRVAGAPEILAKARRDPRWWIRARAAEAAAFLPDAEPALKAGLADPDPRVSSQALETLAASTAPAVTELLDKVLRDRRAAPELRGAALDAAGERKDPALVGALLAATKLVDVSGAGELLGDVRDALSATARAHPETAAKINAALARFPAFTDRPRVFRPLKTAPAVRVETERGAFTIQLASAPDAANHVAAFVESVRHRFYDGLTWHRVVTAFVVQGGDPRGSGIGDAGWRLADEPSRISFERGTVGMPKAGKDTGGCQLFVALAPAPHLDGRYTAFGRVVSGLDVLDRLEPGDKIVSMRLQ